MRNSDPIGYWHDFLNLIGQTRIMKAGKNDKKLFRLTIISRLEAALSGISPGIKEKNLKSAIKKAGKQLANDLYKKPQKKKEMKEVVIKLEPEEIPA